MRDQSRSGLIDRASTGSWCAVVVATRNRVGTLLPTLARLRTLPERPGVVVVDNGSTDGTADRVRAEFPDVRVVRLPWNAGAAGRNIGVRLAATPYVAFSDDDSWWAPGALPRAVEALRNHRRLAVVAAKILVGTEERLDPTSAAMAASRVASRRRLPGPAVIGFVACAAVVRRDAFLQVGGFHPRYGMGSEESLVAMDLAARGWDLTYMDDVVAFHHPHPGPRPGRKRRTVRNSLWTAWLRLPLPAAVHRTVEVWRDAATDAEGWLGVMDAAAGLPWVFTERRAVPHEVQRALSALRDGGGMVPSPERTERGERDPAVVFRAPPSP